MYIDHIANCKEEFEQELNQKFWAIVDLTEEGLFGFSPHTCNMTLWVDIMYVVGTSLVSDEPGSTLESPFYVAEKDGG